VRGLIDEAAARLGSGFDSIITELMALFGAGVAPIMGVLRWLQTRNGALVGFGLLVLFLVLLRRPTRKH
jgi:hypothetical protein